MKILDSRAAVCVQLHLISIVAFHEKGDVTLLRESEYLLKAATIYNTQLENGAVIYFLYPFYGPIDENHHSLPCFLLPDFSERMAASRTVICFQATL